MGERYVVLGLAQPRAEWFRSVAAWSMSGALPAEFVKCVSAEEVRAHLRSGRVVSAAVLDAGLPATDRDLVGAVRDAGAAAIVVDAPGVRRDWEHLGAAAALPPRPERTQVLEALRAHARPVDRGAAAVPEDAEAALAHVGPPAPVVLVCGPGGTGASTVAIALAQGLAHAGRRDDGGVDGARTSGPVVLADLCLRAEQGVLHDAPDVTPAVQELVEAHRGRRPSPGEVRGHTFRVDERGYHLLLGLRHPHHWVAVRPRSFAAAFASLRAAFGTVVCDVTADFEGEADGGSLDVEERHVMARTTAAQASVAVAVGAPGLKGLYALVRLLAELRDAGVPGERIVPVINHAPRGKAARAALARALADLDGAGRTSSRPVGSGPVGSGPVFLPVRRVDDALRDGVRVPGSLAAPLVGAARGVLGRHGVREEAPAQPQPVAPGSLGAFVAEGSGGRNGGGD